MASNPNIAMYNMMISQSPVPPAINTNQPIIQPQIMPISTTPVQSPIPDQMLLKKPSKKQRLLKGEYRRKLKEENQQLKAQIKELEFQIRTKEAENNALQNQMQFFQQYMIGGAEGNDSSTTQTENPDNSTIPTNDNPPI